MPTPRLSDQLAREALALATQHGTISAAARAENMPRETLQRRVNIARERGFHLSAGAQQAMHGAHLNGVEVGGGWRHVYDDETGQKLESVRWKAPDQRFTDEDVLERIAEAFNAIKPAKPIKAPGHIVADLMSLYPLFDVHMNMRAWGAETGGQDYDLKLAAQDLETSIASVMALTPASQQALLVIGGDFFHTDDNRNETPANRHKLDADGRHFKVMDVGVEVMVQTVFSLLRKHEHVYIRVLRGNHDEHSHIALAVGLKQRFVKEPRVTVEMDPHDVFRFQWGQTLIAAHHGDRSKPVDLVMTLAEICEFWSACRHRYVFTGHVHHDQVKDYPGIRWESLRAFCPPDAFGARFAPRRAMSSMTFHKDRGLVLRATDPIERAA